MPNLIKKSWTVSNLDLRKQNITNMPSWIVVVDKDEVSSN